MSVRRHILNKHVQQETKKIAWITPSQSSEWADTFSSYLRESHTHYNTNFIGN